MYAIKKTVIDILMDRTYIKKFICKICSLQKQVKIIAFHQKM